MRRLQKYFDFMSRGIFVAIGGSESENTLKQLIDVVGNDINLLLITAATSYKADAENKYVNIFGGIGCQVNCINAENRNEFDIDENFKKLADADVVFFCGGDQSNISSSLLGTEFLTRMNKRIKKGLVVAGTSAGAMVFSSHMIYGGKDIPRISPGLSFLPNIIIDTHFEERNRMDRLNAAVGMGGGRIGIGISEDTAVFICGNNISVMGEGNATLVTIDGHKVLKSGDKFKI
jgi:cyanophycinase